MPPQFKSGCIIQGGHRPWSANYFRVGPTAKTRRSSSSAAPDLLAVTYGPLPVLTRSLAGLQGVEHAFIYGSWGARYKGNPGPVPADVDVLVIGDVDSDDLDERSREAEAVLRREVNIRRVRPATWEDQEDPFVATVGARPLVELHIDAEADAAPGTEGNDA